MTDRDLTPAEARAEVEAFMGEGWKPFVGEFPAEGAGSAWQVGELYVSATHDNTTVNGYGMTYRAAVDALKTAWRDAVRPWMEAAIEAKLDTADVDGYAPNERVIDRVCEKGMENV